MYASIHGAPNLAGCAADFSPWVEETGPETVTFDVRGLARLFRSPRELAEAIARRAGPQASVAVAPNPDAAVHAARGLGGVTVIEKGEEASRLAGLLVEVLEPPPDIADTLALWGIRTLGELAALPADGVAERLGEAGARLHKLARGAGDRPLAPANPMPPFEAFFELDYPVTVLEPLAFVLGRLLGELCGRLEGRGLATHELALRLPLENRAEHTRTLRLPFPMRDAKAFLKLLTLDLEMHPAPAPVVAVWLRMEPVNPRVVQNGLFLPLAPEPQKLELTLARVAKLVGEERVGSAELVDTHRPGAFRMRRFGDSVESQAGRAHGRGPGRPRVALRVFRPALRARVQAAQGRPARVRARGVEGAVVALTGPWRSSGDWWRADAWSRDEWDIALSDGALYRLYRDRQSGEWYVEGAYD